MLDFFTQRGWSLEETLECPLYTAYLLMGGISMDKIGLRLSDRDSAEYRAAFGRLRLRKLHG